MTSEYSVDKSNTLNGEFGCLFALPARPKRVSQTFRFGQDIDCAGALIVCNQTVGDVQRRITPKTKRESSEASERNTQKTSRLCWIALGGNAHVAAKMSLNFSRSITLETTGTLTEKKTQLVEPRSIGGLSNTTSLRGSKFCARIAIKANTETGVYALISRRFNDYPPEGVGPSGPKHTRRLWRHDVVSSSWKREAAQQWAVTDQRPVTKKRLKNNALLARLQSKNRVRTFDGGQAIVQEIEYSENGTFKRYSGYDVLNISPSDVFTAAQYPIAQAAVAITISGLEQIQNSGKERMINLLESRISNAEKTMQNNMSNDCYSNGTADGGKQIGGLQLLVSAINNSGTIGGIDAGTWGFWQNAVQSFATNGLTPGTSTMQTMMNRLYLVLKRQADRPDLAIGDNTYFRYYWESLQAIQRIQSTDTGMAGFQNLKFMDMDVVADGAFQGTSAGNVSVLGSGGSWLSGSGAPASTLYMLNTDYIYLRPFADRDMVPLDPSRYSVNQDAMVQLIAWAGNMAMSNRFLNGIISA